MALHEMYDIYLFLNTHLTIDIIPNPLHIVPVCNDAVFHWILYSKQAPVLLGSRTNKQLTLQGSRHHADMFWAANAVEVIILS